VDRLDAEKVNGTAMPMSLSPQKRSSSPALSVARSNSSRRSRGSSSISGNIVGNCRL